MLMSFHSELCDTEEPRRAKKVVEYGHAIKSLSQEFWHTFYPFHMNFGSKIGPGNTKAWTCNFHRKLHRKRHRKFPMKSYEPSYEIVILPMKLQRKIAPLLTQSIQAWFASSKHAFLGVSPQIPTSIIQGLIQCRLTKSGLLSLPLTAFGIYSMI